MAHDLDVELERIKSAYDAVSARRQKAEADLRRARDDHQKLADELERAGRGPRDPMPAEGNCVDVTAAPYSAKRDGTVDDGPAIQRAISEKLGRTNCPHTLFLPGGAGPAYRVEQTLRWHTEGTTAAHPRKSGHLGYLIMQGDGHSVLRVPDDCPGFTDAAAPKAVVYTASGDDRDAFTNDTGSGNEAFQNSLYRLTVDTGNNPGAVPIDYMASNKGTVRDVNVATRGPAGISMRRKWPGPCFLKNVTVRGGTVGIDVDQPMYGVTMEDVTCEGQVAAAIRNIDNVLCVRRLKADRPVVNTGRGVVWLLDSPGVQVQSVNAHAVIRERKLNLPVRDAPEYVDRDPADRHYVKPTGRDDTASLQAALWSGKATVWLAAGVYRISGTLRIPPTVRRIFGTDAAIDLPENFQGALFHVEGPHGDPLIVERLNTVGGKEGLGAVWFEHAGRRDLVLRDLYLGVGVNYRNLPGSGDLFVENVHCQGTWEVGHGIGAWMRQFNPETLHFPELMRTKLTNDGATVWVMGLKVEGAGTVIHTKNNGRTEVVGGFMYWNKQFPADVWAFRSENSQVAYGFVEANKEGVGKPELLVRDEKPTGVTELRRSALLGKRLVNYPTA